MPNQDVGERENDRPGASGLPPGFDVTAWTRAMCEASGVPFGVEDPVVLGRLRMLMEHPA